MQTYPTVTVLLPTYNSERFLAEQIASIQSQDYPSIRIHVRDDCSVDATCRIVEQFCRYDSRISLQRNEQNIGQVASVERLLRSCMSPLFALADHDDVWLPSKLSRSVSVLFDGSADLVYTDLMVVDEDLQPLGGSVFTLSRVKPIVGQRPISILMRSPVHGCTVVGRQKMLESALPFPAELPFHDRWLALVAGMGNGLAVCVEPTVLYRQHRGNTVGLAATSVPGLIRNVRRFGQGSLKGYLQRRLEDRLKYLTGLSQQFPLDLGIQFLLQFYGEGRTRRLLLLRRYVRFMRQNASEVGAKALLLETFASTVAPGPRN